MAEPPTNNMKTPAGPEPDGGFPRSVASDRQAPMPTRLPAGATKSDK